MGPGVKMTVKPFRDPLIFGEKNFGWENWVQVPRETWALPGIAFKSVYPK